jgi:hypothetical protein
MGKLTRTCALFLLPALAVTAFAATASALASSPTTDADPKSAPLQVYGERTWPLERGIAYWNTVAGRQVIRYAGRQVAPEAASNPHTVEVTFEALAGMSGLTEGSYGQTPRAITIDPRYTFGWSVYAHEFGHALGLHHHDDPGRYDGVMSYASMWDPNSKADELLWLSRQPDTH